MKLICSSRAQKRSLPNARSLSRPLVRAKRALLATRKNRWDNAQPPHRGVLKMSMDDIDFSRLAQSIVEHEKITFLSQVFCRNPKIPSWIAVHGLGHREDEKDDLSARIKSSASFDALSPSCFGPGRIELTFESRKEREFGQMALGSVSVKTSVEFFFAARSGKCKRGRVAGRTSSLGQFITEEQQFKSEKTFQISASPTNDKSNGFSLIFAQRACKSIHLLQEAAAISEPSLLIQPERFRVRP